MAWIQNVSKSSIATGSYPNPGSNSMLIQIVDPATDFPVPSHGFSEVYQFEFLDIEQDGMTNDGSGSMIDLSEFAITDHQAQQLVGLLQHAVANDMNVVVHCHAGLCRSGAVCEVGVMLGLQDTHKYRQPNLLVKSKMFQHLGWAY